MEPQYKGMNGRIDALSVGWLFAKDHMFFNDGDITWDGTHHSIVGLQCNVELQSEAPILWRNRQTLSQGAADLVLELEMDEDLIVPRSQISPGLHRAIGEGDLTGLTLFNLQACGRAFQFMNGSNVTAYGSFVGAETTADDESNWETVKSVLETAGMGELFENPLAKSMTRVVMFDTRLATGIPNFFGLVAKMYEDMLEYNEINLPYILVFISTTNFDADQYLDDVDELVPGAVSESIHIETNAAEWYEAQEAKKNSGSRKCNSSSKTAKAVSKKKQSSKLSSSAAAPKKSIDYDAERIDPAIADLVACSLIFDGSPQTSKWVSEFIPQVGDTSSAKNYLLYLESIGAIKTSDNRKYKAATTYEGYVGACLDEQVKEIESESYYELILEALIDYDDFAKLDELLVSVEGLPKRDAVRTLLLQGVERGDLEQKGRNLAFRCILDDDKKAAWKAGKTKRAKQRESDLAEISKKKMAAKEGGFEYEAAYQRYKNLLRARQAAEKAAEEKARKKQRIADMKDIDLIVEKIEGYKLGTGFVDAKWIKECVKSIKTIKRAQELLNIAWKEGRIRRNVKDKGFIYAKLLSEDEWSVKLKEAKSGFEQSLKAKASKLAAEHDKRISDERKALTQKVKEADNAIEKAQRDADAAKAKADKLKADYEKKESAFNEITSQIESLDERIDSLDSKEAALKSELESLGLLALSKKFEVKQKISDIKSKSRKLAAEKKRTETDRDQAQQAYEKSGKEYHAAELEVDSKKLAITVAESRASKESAVLSAFESRPTNTFDAASVKPSDEELLGRMESLASEWGAPVATEWLSTNVEGVSSTGVVVRLLASPAGKLIFSQLDSGLYAVEHIDPETTSSSPKNSIYMPSASAESSKPRFSTNASCSGRVPSSVKPGKRVKFGNYRFGSYYGLSSGKKAMYWTVLEVDQDSGYALLLSESSVCHRGFAEGEGMRKAEWPNCKLAEWLESDFKTCAFTATERTKLASCPSIGNPFVLSADEFLEFKKTPGIKPVDIPYQKISEYSSGSYKHYTEKCWLRSTADKGTKASLKITYVTENNGLSRAGTTAGSSMGVRPAIWVDASEVAKHITK